MSDYMSGCFREASPSVCPEEGDFIAYKKALTHPTHNSAIEVIVKLRIPEDAERINPFFTRKCRASRATVLEIKTLDGKDVDKAMSIWAPAGKRKVYRVGETVNADGFDPDPYKKCSKGIYFFMTEDEAIRC